jgi:drug/metabolite transporter (DMT)-like permease
MQTAPQPSLGLKPVLLATLTCLLLTLTLVIVKITLRYFPPLTLSTLRGALAFLTLLPFLVIRRSRLAALRKVWRELILIGVLFFAYGNGALYVGLQFISPTAVSLLLGFLPIIVMVFGVLALRERPTVIQALGVILAVAGTVVFFIEGLRGAEWKGIAIIGVGLFGNASFSILGRRVTRRGDVDGVLLTAIPLAVGAFALLPFALIFEGVPQPTAQGVQLLLILAVFNTSLVYWLYNQALIHLQAFEISAVLNLAPLFTAGWSWLLIGETLAARQFVGIGLVLLGIAFVLKRESGAKEESTRLSPPDSPSQVGQD